MIRSENGYLNDIVSIEVRGRDVGVAGIYIAATVDLARRGRAT